MVRRAIGLKLSATASIIAIVALGGNYADHGGLSLFGSPASAEEGSGGPDNSKGNQGGQGQGSQGAQAGQDNQGGQGSGQGGPDPSSDGKGPQAGGPSDTGSTGGKPVWAQEGIPEVELGRLNVARSPDQVLDRAYAEALSSFTPEITAFYDLDLAAMERELSTNWDNVRFIDSPLQNLALMRDALDGKSALQEVGITTDNGTLLAVFLGTASDKAVPVTTETALAVSAILDRPLTPAAAEALAEDAERIRQAILAGHG